MMDITVYYNETSIFGEVTETEYDIVGERLFLFNGQQGDTDLTFRMARRENGYWYVPPGDIPILDKRSFADACAQVDVNLGL
ncbi:hypothetical protein H8S90_10425 [Olivibacter sp. SDN3]|uniref:hypothetical protein n=1 Tax=Olivibacter sp. SDN3 TaxID=2764720 RepID=UPI0016512E37|nr:hypothetical protein [Olivibacter sp. SDN3]QNL51949.1 hypothetical protein H8S90_10425 [Olivibacter sp. SDN3]